VSVAVTVALSVAPVTPVGAVTTAVSTRVAGTSVVDELEHEDKTKAAATAKDKNTFFISEIILVTFVMNGEILIPII